MATHKHLRPPHDRLPVLQPTPLTIGITVHQVFPTPLTDDDDDDVKKKKGTEPADYTDDDLPFHFPTPFI